MEIHEAVCNSCGAPLNVSTSAKQVSCEYCGAQLEVVRSDAQTATRAVEELREELTRHNRLEEIDREWENRRTPFMLAGKNGTKHVPSNRLVIGYVFFSLFVGAWSVMAISITSRAPDFGPFKVAKFVFPGIGIVATLFGLFLAFTTWLKVDAYKKAERQNQKNRVRMSETIDNDQSESNVSS